MQEARIIEEQQLRDQIQRTIQQARDAATDARTDARNAAAEARMDAATDAAADARDGQVIVTRGGPVGIPMTSEPWAPADIPPRAQEVAIASLFTIATIIIGFPIARAFARRIDRSGLSPKIPTQVTSELAQLNQAVESIAIEVERISEGQRFTTKLLSEQHKLSTPSGEAR